MKNFLLLCLVLALTIPSSHGSEQIRQVQEELRKRNLYFGEIDGNPSEPLKKALARYQSVKGLAESGAADISTLQSLGMETALAENVAPLPNVAVLKSDVPRELTDEDRRLAESQVVEALNSPGEGPSEPQATTLFAANSLPGGGDPMEPDPLLTEENVKKFVQDYLEICESNNLDAEMGHYSETVNYFDHGNRDRNFIRKDVQSYYRRWPNRAYQLEEIAVTPSVSANERVARFRIHFEVSSAKSSARGNTSNVFKVQKMNDALYFTSMKEQRLRP